jgi:hypothetical protein
VPKLKSKLTPLGIEHVLQSPDGRTLKPTFLRFISGWMGVEFLDSTSQSLGTVMFEGTMNWLEGDSLQVAGLEVEVSLKVSFNG